MYELANEPRNTTQIKALTNHDRNVCNDVIKENTEVYDYLPRNTRDKLWLKWTRPVHIIKGKHPSYLIVSKARAKAYKMNNKRKTKTK